MKGQRVVHRLVLKYMLFAIVYESIETTVHHPRVKFAQSHTLIENLVGPELPQLPGSGRPHRLQEPALGRAQNHGRLVYSDHGRIVGHAKD